ncbi:MAG: nitrile hydratase subunit beta [Rhizobiales bacterium]|nr:nitrile hydratase [Rhodobiaceae bacterium]MBL6624291.1 nitrile hydratase subunit beta [Hyphomicrobiales bacterium]MBL6771088.1 nitrile hydratase subunit beta [Hyphomicrobiales bacterium]RPF96187.1 MAG: nitrile hydratase subunit beta [Rhizobiales bacterium TMED227]|tara:strand:+ start:154 stop:438 length:285 start_codon:yes stop_codon:yes gene_type:complete
MKTKFKINDSIIVDDRVSTSHCRTPSYIRGKEGIVERVCGEFPNPEEIALSYDNPSIIPLYRCRFKQAHVWKNYKGSNIDTLELEIYEHWLKKK